MQVFARISELWRQLQDLRKESREERLQVAAMANLLQEWESPEDDEAFADL
jgi:hypothetical protein